MKPLIPCESFQRRDHLQTGLYISQEIIKPVTPWHNDARESVISMSRRLATLIIKKSARGGFKNV